ncbi:ArsA family ATPase, partial [Aeromicrobium sp. REDSEA-S32_B7]|uniref:ArsA family ATPase n=1 Tax=Aeromicrobium sp. REDSEA-S32_B7 TaxID=1811526 RepID=UPI0034DAE481
SMGIEELDNTPRPVADVDATAGGSLDAMMLDMKSTFDEVVLSQATPEKARAILENPFYIVLSTSFAGTQEYMAMEKLGQIHADAQERGTYDLIVVDTPPSRSALDFLDAPERLSSFLDGRFIRLMLAPAKGPAKLMTAGLGLVTGALTKVLGAQVLTDLQTFVAAGPRAAHLRAAAGPGHGVRRRGGAGAGRAARSGVLRRAVERRPDAAGRARGEPGQPRAAREALGRGGAGRRRADRRAPGGRCDRRAHRRTAAAARRPDAQPGP